MTFAATSFNATIDEIAADLGDAEQRELYQQNAYAMI